MKQSLLSMLLITSIKLTCLGQNEFQTFVFEGNNFRWNQTTNGSLFYNETESFMGLEVPINESNFSIFASTLWVGGLNENDELKISYRRFCSNEDENCFENWGPLKLDGSMHSAAEVEMFNHVWFVTAESIDEHMGYFDCLNNPNCNIEQEYPDYSIPSDFLTWPAEGQNGFAENLAPFIDYNNDGFYTPEEGDHPAICGDFSSYAIWNDMGIAGASSDGNEIGLEVHTTVYGYDSGIESDFNTLFVKHKLINRGSHTLQVTYTGFWTDFDIGNPNDDYVQTDVARSMFFGYNGIGFDGGSSSGPGYGSDVPAMGVKILSGPLKDSNNEDDEAELENSYGNEAAGYGDGIIDNERLGLYASLAYNNASGPIATRDPQTGLDYYNYMQSIWKDGAPLTFGGSGYPPEPPVITSKYMFVAETDPLLAGTNGIDPEYPFEGGWTEENEGFPAEDRRMVGSSGPFTFTPGDIQYIDLAYIFARQSYDENETEIETLQRFADEVEGRQCEPLPPIVLSTNSPNPQKLDFEVFPNPAQQYFTVDLKETFGKLNLFDLTGKLILQDRIGSVIQRVDTSNLTEGIYLIQISAENKIYHSKIIITK
ncbi:MAG: T9SS type A sorting domain-containing protein [Bacteroidota bacterium]